MIRFLSVLKNLVLFEVISHENGCVIMVSDRGRWLMSVFSGRGCYEFVFYLDVFNS